ncbi:hypothetical protein LOAG_09276 [Loa loa]|uniref:Uncharacterized protein n=1 Tax=Loa loa TaxID=7209 RepID=A0A1S0TS86_LOALO|nr:hypothetical protein LOAG_09276 [Loa loa]EFO19217.1 hypothetical protein LOAG_09276 [Loa loa]
MGTDDIVMSSLPLPGRSHQSWELPSSRCLNETEGHICHRLPCMHIQVKLTYGRESKTNVQSMDVGLLKKKCKCKNESRERGEWEHRLCNGCDVTCRQCSHGKASEHSLCHPPRTSFLSFSFHSLLLTSNH